MRHLVRKAVLVLVLTIFAIALVVPPSKQLKAGRDLKGGVNFVYFVEVSGDAQSRQAVMDRVKEVVKERLDPKGVMDITVTQQGSDRLEISMPLASAEVRARSAKFEEELAKLGKSAIDEVTFDRIMRAPAAEREAEFKQYTGADGERWNSVNRAIQAYESMEVVRAPYEAAAAELDDANRKLAEADPAVLGAEFYDLLKKAVDAASEKASQLADPLLDAEQLYAAARTAALSTGVTSVEVRRVLRLRNEPIYVSDRKNPKERVKLESRREDAIKALIDRHPGSKAEIESVVKAWDDFEKNRSTLNDPSDLMRLLKGAGVLNFRIAVDPGELANEQELREQLRKFGPIGARSDQARWYRINKIENWLDDTRQIDLIKSDPAEFFRSYGGRGYVGEELDGEYYLLLWDTKDNRLTEKDGKRWSLRSAYQGQDRLGRPAIDFAMDPVGADMLGELTGQNVGKKMAVILDDEIYTAPTLNSQISSNGVIEGEFSSAEISYIIKVLSHGSLEGKLSNEPISVQVVAAEAGADNLRKGLLAGFAGFALCAGFMVVYYFSCGLISVFALLLNALFIVAAMSFLNSPFTLPGIAGIVLVFGQAIDANVLIYERMREEMQRGLDFKTSVRLGYDKALSAIIDSNITTFIVCVVLGFTGTQEIKGFAITLGLGNAMTLFTQLFVTRIIFGYLVEYKGIWRKASMLPMAVPAINRAFSLTVDWMRYRHVFIAISLAFTVGSLALIVMQGREMLGSEFRGGTKVSIKLAHGADGNLEKRTRADISKLIDEAAAESTDPTMKNLTTASITVVNPDPDNQTLSNEFSIKTSDTRAKEVQAAVLTALRSLLDAEPALQFKDSDKAADLSPTYPIIEAELGKNIFREAVRNPVAPFVGGVAIVLDDINPPATLASIEERLSQFRRRTEFQDISGRKQQVIVVRGSPDAVQSAVLVVSDPGISFLDSKDRWTRELQLREWALVKSALTESTTLSNVESFSPVIARTFQAQAVIAVLLSSVMVIIFVWVRFGSLRYSLAAIITTLHDCLVAVGAIAFAQVLCKVAPGPAAALGILPFQLELNLVAAVLTILGFSLNDTVIVMDRIRELKGKLDHAPRYVINDAINKTISRTIITSGTTLFAVVVLYAFGGEAVRGFSYAMLIGVFIGTYSSIAVAAPLVWSEHHELPGTGHKPAGQPPKSLDAPAGA